MIYILGTGYCGTTLLGLTLGNHNKITKLGELSFFLDSFFKDIYRCTCGKIMNSCEYWKDFYFYFNNYTNKSLKEKYKMHYEYFKYKHPETLFLDSSMRLDFYYQIENFIDYPILITKDVRNWSVSVMKKHGGSAFKRFIRWYIENKKFQKSNIDYLKIGYEEFALFNEEIMKKICEFIDVNFEEEMLFPYNTKSHLIWGNPMNKDKKRVSKIFYDYRWFNDYSVCLAFSPMPFVKKLNDELVYSNNLINNFNYNDKK